MNKTHYINNRHVFDFARLLAACLIPIIPVFVFMAIGIEYYSIGGFIPYLMLLFCPIAYLIMEYPKVLKQITINTLKNKLR